LRTARSKWGGLQQGIIGRPPLTRATETVGEDAKKQVTAMRCLTRLAAAATSVGAVVALTFSVRWSYADWLSTQPSLYNRLRAATLSPGDATVWLRLADLASVGGEDVRPTLTRAVQCSPSDSRIWIRLGLESEVYREYGKAERFLLRATELDHDIVPVWTLANFYFRRGDSAGFFPTARRILAFSRGDLNPVFRMAWAIAPDGSRMLTEGMPDGARPLTAYLNWLLSADLFDAADPVSVQLLSRFPREGSEALLSYCDRLIAAGRWGRAVRLWNDMDARELVATGPVRRHAILNSSFRPGSLNRGFDWRLASVPGIEANPDGASLWIRFSGRQRDRAEIASQPILIDRGVSYRLHSRLESSGIDVTSGLSWAILHPRDSTVVSRSADFSTANTNSEWTFAVDESGTDAGATALRLVLMYERAPAEPRGNGWVRVDSLSLERLP
jgi:hypothetical protein